MQPTQIPNHHHFFHCRITDPSHNHSKYIAYLDQHYECPNNFNTITSYIYCLEDVDKINEHIHIHFSASQRGVVKMRNWLRQTCRLNGRPTKGVTSQYSLKACRSILQSAIYTCKDSSGCLECCFGYSDNYPDKLIEQYQNSSYKKEEKRDFKKQLQSFIDEQHSNGYIPLTFHGEVQGDIGTCYSFMTKLIDFYIKHNKIPPNRSYMFRLLLTNNYIDTSMYLKLSGLIFED